MYSIEKIDRLRAEAIEYLGTKRKFWFTQNGERHLFKAEERGTGEDWAERIACELAQELGVPHVKYDLAHEYEGDVAIQPGVICPSFASPPLSLEMGNQLLMRRIPTYPYEEKVRYGIREYTIEAVATVIGDLAPPASQWMDNIPRRIETAFDVFLGYIMLDTWIANQDRHHQNWGAVREGEILRLAPTYDHGSSLARNVTDKERIERMRTKDKNRTMETFTAKARSGFYRTTEDAKTLLSSEVFVEFSNYSEGAADIWMDRLDSIGVETVESILEKIPAERMTDNTKEFTLELLKINQRRILQNRF